VVSIDKRRSDRVQLELRIQLAGVDAAGRNFAEQTRTLVVSRHGAKVVSARVLLPQQALTLRCYRTGLETLARVVGQIGQEGEHTCYGLGIADSQVNVWGINSPRWMRRIAPRAGFFWNARVAGCKRSHTSIPSPWRSWWRINASCDPAGNVLTGGLAYGSRYRCRKPRAWKPPRRRPRLLTRGDQNNFASA